MSKKTAKQKILKVAEGLLITDGYSALNTNNIAELANISVGTLYYHFKNGKKDILNVLIERVSNQYLEEVSKMKGKPFKTVLLRLIEIHRPYAAFLRALESEILSSITIQHEFDKIFEDDKEKSLALVKEIIEDSFGASSNLEKKANFIGRMLDDLIHTHVIFDNYYGSDEEFAEKLNRMIKGLLF